MAKKPTVKPKPYTPARVKKLAKDPGTRSTIPTRLLPQQYRGEREKNARLNSPVAPGSALTNRQLGRDTKSYMTQKYAQGDQAERQGIATQEGINRDTTGWYQQYLQDLRTHAANVGTFAAARSGEPFKPMAKLCRRGHQASLASPSSTRLRA